MFQMVYRRKNNDKGRIATQNPKIPFSYTVLSFPKAVLGTELEHVEERKERKKGKGLRHDQETEEQVQVAGPGHVEKKQVDKGNNRVQGDRIRTGVQVSQRKSARFDKNVNSSFE